jgi:hypothetical protein
LHYRGPEIVVIAGPFRMSGRANTCLGGIFYGKCNEGYALMTKTVEVIINEQGRVFLLGDISLPETRRALVTLLDEEPTSGVSETALLSQQSLAEDWNRPEEDAAWSHLRPVAN